MNDLIKCLTCAIIGVALGIEMKSTDDWRIQAIAIAVSLVILILLSVLFKTDKKEEPFLYFPQQSAYRAAAAVLLHVPESAIRCFLYYLRSGHLIDITQECDAVDLKAVLLKTALSN